MNKIILAFSLLTTFANAAQVDRVLTIDEVREWAVKQGSGDIPGQTDEGTDCRVGLLVSSDNGVSTIYLSLGHSPKNGSPMLSMGGYVQSATPVTGQSQVSALSNSKNIDLEFTGQYVDDRYQGQDEIRTKIRIEKSPSGNGVMKAIGSSSAFPKEIICRFISLVS